MDTTLVMICERCARSLGMPGILDDDVRNLLMVPSGTRRLKAMAQEVSVNKD
jgi:hypothetical protein